MIQPNVNVEALMGPCFLLMWLSFILYGLVLAQVYFYFTTYRDHIFVRLVIILLCALETLHVAVCIHMIYTYLIIDFSHPEMVLKIIWSGAASVYLEVPICGIVSLHYIYRIWGLSKNIQVSAYLIIVTCVRIGLELKSAAFLAMEESWLFSATSLSYKREGSAAFALGLLADMSITIAFLLALNRNRSHARARGTKNIVRSLMHYALSSGILIVMLSLATLIMFVGFRPKLHSGGTLALLSKVYTNSMLAMLNRREGIKRDATLNDGFSLQLSNLPKEGSDSGHRPTITKVEVTHDTVTTSDTWFIKSASKSAASELGPHGIERASEVSCA